MCYNQILSAFDCLFCFRAFGDSEAERFAKHQGTKTSLPVKRLEHSARVRSIGIIICEWTYQDRESGLVRGPVWFAKFTDYFGSVAGQWLDHFHKGGFVVSMKVIA